MCVVILNGKKDDSLKQCIIVGRQITDSAQGVSISFTP